MKARIARDRPRGVGSDPRAPATSTGTELARRWWLTAALAEDEGPDSTGRTALSADELGQGLIQAIRQLSVDGPVPADAETGLLAFAEACGVPLRLLEAHGGLSLLSESSAQRRLLLNQLPNWRVLPSGEIARDGSWGCGGVSLHRLKEAPSGPARHPVISWTASDQHLASALQSPARPSQSSLQGTGELTANARGLTLEGANWRWELALADVTGLGLRLNGAELASDDDTWLLLHPDGWMLAELIRLLMQTRPSGQPSSLR